MKTLVNLPSPLLELQAVQHCWDRLRKLGELRLTSHDVIEDLEADFLWADAVMMWSWPSLTAAEFDKHAGLRYLGHIDVSRETATALQGRSIPVALGQGGWTPAVSEMALTLILSLLRRTSDYHACLRQHGTWQLPGNEACKGFNFPSDERMLSQQRVGIVGFGNIGQRLRNLLRPFGCEVMVFDPFLPTEQFAAFQVRPVDMDTLAAESDVLVLAAASNAGTEKILSRERIQMLKSDAVLVNVSRAQLVDTEALIGRLRSTPTLRAATDVFDKEPAADDHPLRDIPNAYLTPHRAGGLLGSVVRCVGELADDLERALNGEALANAFDPGTMLARLDG